MTCFLSVVFFKHKNEYSIKSKQQVLDVLFKLFCISNEIDSMKQIWLKRTIKFRVSYSDIIPMNSPVP